MWAPYHTVPDGSVALPHRATWALLVAIVPIMTIWDWYPRRDPWPKLLAALGGLIDFLLVWPCYPVLGAIISVAAVVVPMLLPLRVSWWER